MRTYATILLALLPAGCVTMDKVLPGLCQEKPPTGPVHQVVVTWNNEVMHAADPVHNGTLVPGIGGRLFLFGPQIDFPLAGDGTITVDLFDETAGPAQVPMERWIFDPDTLKRLIRKDMVGWGYTLFLRWSTYKPEVAVVRLKLCYQPKKGSPLYAESAPMTLNDKQFNAQGPPLVKKPSDSTVTPTSAPKTPTPNAMKPVGSLLPAAPTLPGPAAADAGKNSDLSTRPQLGFSDG